MIILAAAAALTMTQIGEAAYISGRCAMYQPPRAQLATMSELTRLHPRLVTLYRQGIEDSEREPIGRATCVRLLADIDAEFKAAAKP